MTTYRNEYIDNLITDFDFALEERHFKRAEDILLEALSAEPDHAHVHSNLVEYLVITDDGVVEIDSDQDSHFRSLELFSPVHETRSIASKCIQASFSKIVETT